MRTPPCFRRADLLGLLPFVCLALHAAQGGSATWRANPVSSDWNDASNWMPNTVPNGPADVATFAGSSGTTPRFSATMTEVAQLVFDPDASSFNITADSRLAGASVTFTISGAGLTNNSAVTQTLSSGPSKQGKSGTINFLNAATAGEGTALTALGSVSEGGFGGSKINFYNTSTASTATVRAEGATGSLDAGGGEINFFDNATAADASFTSTGSVGGYGGAVNFSDSSTASNATFTTESPSNGGFFGGEVNFFDNATAQTAQFTVSGGGLDVTFSGNATAADATFLVNNGQVTFEGFDFNDTESTAGNGLFTINGSSSSQSAGGTVLFIGGTAGNATLIANAGTNVGAGGAIFYFDDDESTARIELFGNGKLSVGGEVTVGSIEGNGLVVLNNHKLLTGSNNLSTTFSGTIEQFGSGSLEKIGTGTLTLSGASTYAGGTTISSGLLLVSNVSGSGTGTGGVNVNAGTLGGSGIIAGAVTVGTNTGVQAFLAPSKGANKPSTVTIQSALTLNDDSTYIYQLNTKRAVSDEVIANGVTIDSGARFLFRPSGNNALTTGQVFAVINNTAATPITGTFHNLPEGKILTVNGSSLQASYSGGDGNDLTLTVVP